MRTGFLLGRGGKFSRRRAVMAAQQGERTDATEPDPWQWRRWHMFMVITMINRSEGPGSSPEVEGIHWGTVKQHKGESVSRNTWCPRAGSRSAPGRGGRESTAHPPLQLPLPLHKNIPTYPPLRVCAHLHSATPVRCVVLSQRGRSTADDLDARFILQLTTALTSSCLILPWGIKRQCWLSSARWT